MEDNDDMMQVQKEKILNFIKLKEYKPMKIKNIMMFMEVPPSDRELFMDIINTLTEKGEVTFTEKGKVMLPESLNLIYGTYMSMSAGFGFVLPENNEDGKNPDIFIRGKSIGVAMHKDKVLCKITDTKTGKRPEGIIIKVVKRGQQLIVGTFEKNKSFGFVVQNSKKMYKDIYIPKRYTMDAVTGHKVVVKIFKDGDSDKNPEGKIVEILGHINEPGIDILSIIKEFEFSIEFDEDVIEQIENIPNKVIDKDIIGRTDFRHLQTVTIDGDDAKDLDDAITIEKLDNQNYKLGVHIADVTHYVKKGTPLDREAIKRGTSIYLVDRVIPMLPQKLSNGICSLNAFEDRLSLSCVMEIDKYGKVCSYEILKAVINVDKRMSYPVINDILMNENSKFLDENKELLDMFETMKELRNILLKKRVKRGAIDFDFPEAKIILDQNGKTEDIKLYERNIATSIIEEFMLLANETIAEHYFWLDVPFVYRSHDEPDEEKVNEMLLFISRFGYNLKGQNIHSKAFQDILKQAKNTPEDMLINRVVLRSFKQAKYTHKNNGHFGLAAQYYCHFTSPIRRYPDLQIHRIIKASIDGEMNEKMIYELEKKLPSICQSCSFRERLAEEAERKTVKVKKAEYMADKIGQIYEGIISGITSRGLYVELKNTVEGFVSAETISDDIYHYDEKNLQYFGDKTGNTYTFGDKVKIEVSSVNIDETFIDFKIIDN